MNNLFPETFLESLTEVSFEAEEGDFASRAHLRRPQEKSENRRRWSYGDSVRDIDWKATARLDEMIVRPRTDIRSRKTLLWLDRSDSLTYQLTRDYAQRRLAFAVSFSRIDRGGMILLRTSKGEEFECRTSFDLLSLQTFLENLDISAQADSNTFAPSQDTSDFDETIVLSDPWFDVELVTSEELIVSNTACWFQLRVGYEHELPFQNVSLVDVENKQSGIVDFSLQEVRGLYENYPEQQLSCLRENGWEVEPIFCPPISSSLALLESFYGSSFS